MFYFNTEPRLKWNKIVLPAKTILFANVNSRSSSVYAVARPSVVCLSSVTRHPLTSIKNFTEIVPVNPSVGGGLNARGVAKYSDFGPTDGYISESVQYTR